MGYVRLSVCWMRGRPSRTELSTLDTDTLYLYTSSYQTCKLNIFVCFSEEDKVLECESDGPRVKIFVSYVRGTGTGRPSGQAEVQDIGQLY